ncbi:lipoprotein signal peptidase [Mangrovivirga sp. M17]|uniref:Lipoprotein signal peptidase n=1 Tax=Mangrovivirga halotolerans TaxID=2993936 RepID=A0ABT3RT18_9BACT|nr:lipoprotein signal peptidase [Mangrovivirga halotolerans]
MKLTKFYLLTLLVIIVDQASKMWVYHNMYQGEDINVIGDWFKLHYTLNPGMAFGWKMDFEYGKLILTTFRIIAVGAIGYYIYYLYKKGVHDGLLYAIALILGGALGNVIDSTFYGIFLEGNVMYGALFPLFHGQVIDMLYFPMIDSTFPEWVPIWGGDSFQFFRPVFNIADSCIFVGVVLIFINKKRFFND